MNSRMIWWFWSTICGDSARRCRLYQLDIFPLTDYAALFRYSNSPALSEEMKVTIKDSVRILREHVIQRIDALRSQD